MPVIARSTARLLATCADQPGIVAQVSRFLYERGANIIHSDQHSTDPEGGRFFLRQEFYMQGLEGIMDRIKADFSAQVAEPFCMTWGLHPAWVRKKVAILVSRLDHGLMDLLWRAQRGELPMDVTMVISNHPDLGNAARSFGVPFFHVPVEKGGQDKACARMLELLEDNADFLVLARYMQIIHPDMVERFKNRIVNIHHSFLPAFVGADPYRRASERGVKLIGATAHYVTEELDEGPIIEQDVIRVSHRQSLDELKVLGHDIERQVLSRAVKWHLEDRILVDGNKTIVFV
ncbi:MAG: formyltetrahydrofolate deformylase [Desulfovibrionaceae bacterium]